MLIKCPECGKEFSEYASACPHCGCPKEMAIAIKGKSLLLNDKIKHVQCLYDVGERNLTCDDIVKINNLDFYVLQIIDDKAELISKDIYDVRYGDDSNISIINGGDYTKSQIDQWMNKFYFKNLSSVIGLKVIDSDLTYYLNGTFLHTTRKVFALSVPETEKYYSKFYWGLRVMYKDNPYEEANGFFVAASYGYSSYGERGPFANIITCGGRINAVPTNLASIGARPVFWVQLEK